MCGRFVSASPPDEVARYFDAAPSEAALEASYNVAPTNQVYVVLESGGVRSLDTMRWGLVPFWADDTKIGNRLINARAETVATKNAFRHAFKKKRCIIPADGFYEWKAIPGQKKKQPYFIHRPDGEPYAFAGLWETWRPKPPKSEDGTADGAGEGGEAEVLHTCTIITGTPNERMAQLHDRMPIMLPPDAWATWLDEDNHDTDLLGKLLVPAPSELIAFHTVSTQVNNPRTEGDELVEEAPPIDAAPEELLPEEPG
jgi:putative SOS response-associated peptidase YedK